MLFKRPTKDQPDHSFIIFVFFKKLIKPEASIIYVRFLNTDITARFRNIALIALSRISKFLNQHLIEKKA